MLLLVLLVGGWYRGRFRFRFRVVVEDVSALVRFAAALRRRCLAAPACWWRGQYRSRCKVKFKSRSRTRT